MPSEDRDSAGSLRDALQRGERELRRVGPILGLMLTTVDQSLYSEEIVARVRGMLNDLAWQLLRAQADAAGQAGKTAFAERHGEALAEHLQADLTLLEHCLALALEWQLACRLEAEYGLDPVLAPLMQNLIASNEAQTASAAMTTLAAQARFAQSQRRMELPLSELTADLFHAIVMAWRTWNGPHASDVLVRAEARLRNGFDEGTSRLALLARLVAGIPSDETTALKVEDAGVSLFLSALAARAGQPRDIAVLATNVRQATRLSLMLRAAGCAVDEIGATQLRLHPERMPPHIGSMSSAEALDMLGQLATGAHG